MLLRTMNPAGNGTSDAQIQRLHCSISLLHRCTVYDLGNKALAIFPSVSSLPAVSLILLAGGHHFEPLTSVVALDTLVNSRTPAQRHRSLTLPVHQSDRSSN